MELHIRIYVCRRPKRNYKAIYYETKWKLPALNTNMCHSFQTVTFYV